VLKAGGRDPLGLRPAPSRAADADPARAFPADAPKVGDLVWLQPGHCDPTNIKVLSSDEFEGRAPPPPARPRPSPT
jgi:hypothetical protein